jgi:NADPH-dependent glutamate synthase beta subunit-like oxidoreductase
MGKPVRIEIDQSMPEPISHMLESKLGVSKPMIYRLDQPVGIDFLKRYVADQDMIGEMWTPETKQRNGNRIAIIGGGPAGRR